MAAFDSSDIFSWTRADAQRLLEAGGRKAAIVEREHAFWRLYHDDFDGADQAVTEAIQAAREEGELRWELFLRHWRVQLWLKDDLRRALPEAIDLLNLVTDERVRDVPQRICAFHDVVYCHLAMDPVGYAEDVLANSESVLEQTPARYACSDCARMNAATALAATGRAEEARAWLARFRANQWGTNGDRLNNEAHVYELLGQWEEVERIARQAVAEARKSQKGDEYLEALIHLGRAQIELKQLAEARETLAECRRFLKYAGGTYLLSQVLEMDGRFSVAIGASGDDYLTRAAQRFLALGRYREAALAGLAAAEHIRELRARQDTNAATNGPVEAIPDIEPSLNVAAEAIGALPAASDDLVARLAAFGWTPSPPRSAMQEAVAPDAQANAESERRALETELDAHLANGNARGVATALYRLGAWLAAHDQPRAAVDYLLLNGVLERAMRLPISDREDALNALGRIQERLPQGSIEKAFTAFEEQAPERFAMLFAGIAPNRWRWLVRAVQAEWRGEPVVEPEDVGEDREEAFSNWVEHNASMTALVVRFRERTDPAKVAHWTRSMEQLAADIAAQPGPNGEEQPLVAFVRALAMLSGGTPAEEALRIVQEPFTSIVRKVVALSSEPVWRHPGNAPIDLFIERDAQLAVRALRASDDQRASRLENMAFRFELQAIDIAQQESLAGVAQFLNALAATVRTGGVMPADADQLPAELRATLAAVCEAGQVAS